MFTEEASRVSCKWCGSIRRVPFLRHPAAEDLDRCRDCGLIEADPSAFRSEGDRAGGAELSDEEFREVFSERLDPSDAGGNLYASFGISQADMAAGLFAEVNAAIRSHLRPRTEGGLACLEVGCATGFLLDEIRNHYPDAEIQGVEPSPVSCAKAQALYGIRPFLGTLSEYESRSERFDLILILGNLQLHENPFRTLRQAHRLLAPGGVLLFDMKNPTSAARRLTRLATRLPSLRDGGLTAKAVERGFTCMRFAVARPRLVRIVRELGFEVLEAHTTPPRAIAYGGPETSHARGAAGMAWKLLDRLDRLTDQRAWIRLCCRRPP